MTRDIAQQRRYLEQRDAEGLERHQLGRLNRLLETILPHNRFYAAKLRDVALPITSLDAFEQIPFTTKEELCAGSQTGAMAANRTWAIERYTRFHRTSGTHGRPLVVLDTPDDWQWWIDTWQFVLDAAQVSAADRATLAFSFGPFIGFWSAYDALAARGAMVVPGGGMSTEARLELLRDSQATVVCCTPSYALRMAEVAADRQIDLTKSLVRCLIVAGEPGGSIPAVRERIETAWGASVIDHAGATEVGPWGYSDADRRGVHVIESEFIAEFLSLGSGQAAGDGVLSELVLTTLGRSGSPVIRYRTGDLVRPTHSAKGPNRFVLLEGGVIGRADDMKVIRGVNVFPSSVEQIVRGFPEVVEFRATAYTQGQMDQLRLEIEEQSPCASRVARELEVRLGLRVDIQSVPVGSLPRFEGKAKRFLDERQ
jgi:phenylacetate-CoA ligase